MKMPKPDEFEIAVLSVDGTRPVFCFPHSGRELAEAVARMLVAYECYDRRLIPLLITDHSSRMLALCSLIGADNIMIVINLDSPRWRELDLGRTPMDVLRLDKDGELEIYEGDSYLQSEEPGGGLLGRLWCCAAERGNMGDAAECICALAEIAGCGLELTVSSDNSRDVACDVAAAIMLYMLMLCLRTGADRGCRISIARRDGQVEISGEFKLCPDEFLPSDGEEWAEIAACRRLADAHNVPFEYQVERGGVSIRFCPMCREWSRLGIKIPRGLEYD